MTGVFSHISGQIMQYSGMSLLANLALKLVPIAVFRHMIVRAYTAKADFALHPEVSALLIAEPLNLLTVIHCMRLHLARVRCKRLPSA